ncbi:MAG: LD-carboxypeptidase [Firmicutes bacterium]|nr:LD-carboxypeptidase [Bacillota bacterium]
MIGPKRLQQGDTVMAVSLSSGLAHRYPHRYQVGKKQLQDTFGVKVMEGEYTLRSEEWMYRNPQARAEDLMNAFVDRSIDGVVSVIGGCDSIRRLSYLDFDLFRQNPKIFLGNSDATVTHFVLQKAGVGSYYGPSLMTGFAENGGNFGRNPEVR